MSVSKLKNKAQNVKAGLPDQEKGNRKQPKKFYPLHNFDKIKKKTVLGGDILYYFLVFLWFITCICFLICLSVIKKRKKENKDYRGAKMGAYVFLFAAILLFIDYSVIGNSQEENRNVPQYTIFH